MINGIIEWFGEHRRRPLAQSAMLLLTAILLQGLVALFGKATQGVVDAVDVWVLCPAMMLLYVIYNTLRGFEQEEMGVYYSHSVYGLLLYLVADIGWCVLLTGRSVEEVGSMKWILFVFGIVYLVFLSILNLIRFIMKIVMHQDRRAREEAEQWVAGKTGGRQEGNG